MKPLKLCALPQVNANEEGTLPTRQVKPGSYFVEKQAGIIQGEENPVEDSLGTPCYFQEEH